MSEHTDTGRGLTPSQTVGPFFHYGLLTEDLTHLVADDHEGAVRIHGTVYDGAGDIVPDAMLEIWQANPAGRYAHPADDREDREDREDTPPDDDFSGFGRCATDPEGNYSFTTVRPGAVGGQAPHILVNVFARGLLKQLTTRIYFPDEAEANAGDTVLNAVPDDMRDTLVADDEGDGRLRFDIRLQGEGQTAFLDV